jgi:hypothetical protein
MFLFCSIKLRILLIRFLYGKIKWTRRAFRKKFNFELNLDNPKTFSEKIQFLKLYDEKIQNTFYADKYLVRHFVSSVIGSNYLVPCIKYLSAKELDVFDFNSIQKDYVIKASHGSGWVEIVFYSQLKAEDILNLKRRLKKWLSINYYKFSFEPQYKNLMPGLIIEEMLLDDGKLPNDYKFHCFNGVVKFIHIAMNRGQDEEIRLFYTRDWEKLDFKWSPLDKRKKFKKSFLGTLSRPENLDDLLHIAEKLSEYFLYVRVDLYSIREKIYFGELTFHPGSGFDVFEPFDFDYYYGECLDVSSKSLLII